MAAEQAGEKVACNIRRKAESAGSTNRGPGRQPAVTQPCAGGEPKPMVHRSRLCRRGTENGSERAWRGSGFFILAML